MDFFFYCHAYFVVRSSSVDRSPLAYKVSANHIRVYEG